jgi:prepilin-type N-terminal cleavage/methylation domain-containing protein
MRSKQSGFTLVEIAIVLVIIGLLLGGVLKGQELINSAKVKNMAVDFRNIPLFIYGYQDKYKALPGDHASVATAVTGATACTPAAAGLCVPGNGVINGTWNAALANAAANETLMFWQHVRLAGLAAGPTSITDTGYRPTNADGGLIGIESGAAANGGPFIQNGTIAAATGVVTALATPTFFSPTYMVCSDGILGKYAKQLDSTLDDGETGAGSVRVVNGTNATTPHARGAVGIGTAGINDSLSYTVCMGL